MEVSVRREELMRGLYRVQGVVERRNTVPILSNVLIEPAENGIALSATNMEIGLRGTVPAQVKKKGTVTVNARKLYEIVREVTAEDVVLKFGAAGWVDLLAGRSRFKIVSLDAKDYPELPLGAGAPAGVALRVAAGTLREMIDKTLFAASDDDSRFNLAGVYVETPERGTVRMVATDGHRLAMIDRAVADAWLGDRDGGKNGVILPRKGLLEARKLLDETDDAEITLTIADKDVRLHTPAVSFFMRLVEGEFPDYKQVVPSSSGTKATLNRDDLLAALRRMSLLASERSHGVKLSLQKGGLELSASSPEQGEASEDLEAAYAGEPLSIGFNVRYLMDVLGVLPTGETIEFGLTDDVGPGVLRGSQDPSYTYVVMPMRL
jgi:DNA polymerase-3 subunit beta